MVGLGRGYVRPYRRLAQHAPALRSISPLGLSENVFRDFFNLLEPTEEEVARQNLQTGHFLVNAIETDSAYELAIQLPGLKKDEVDISLEEGELRVAIEKKEEGEVTPAEEGTPRRFLVHEWVPSSGSRSFALPKDADPEKVSATMADGILTVKVAKMSEKQPKRVEIH